MRHILFALLLLGCNHDAHPAATSNTAAPPEPAPAEAAPAAPVCPAGWGPMMAQQHVVDHPCALRPEQVGCLAPDQACADGITYAIDPQGQGWWFMDTCIPDGWRATPYPQGLGGPPPACDQN